MELPPIPVTPAPAAGAASPVAVAPENSATADAAAPPAPGFAELLAAGLALPQAAGDAALAAPPAGLDPLLPDMEITAAGDTATGAPDPTLALVLASIALPGAGLAPEAVPPGDAASAPRAPMQFIEATGAPPAAPRAERAIASVPPFQLAERETDTGQAAAALRADAITDAAAALQSGESAHVRPLQAASVHAPAVAGELRAPVGAHAWDAQLGRTVVWMAGERHQMAEVRLNPPDLGPLEIVLRLSGDAGNQASVTFASPHAEVRAALETALPRLRDMLAESGISLGQASVNSESFRDAGGARHSGANGSPASAAAGSAPALHPAAVRMGAGLVDIFA